MSKDELEKWEFRQFQSGTHIVTRQEHNKPHYYIYADERFKICEDLTAWLNSGLKLRPLWADSLKFDDSETALLGSNGIHLLSIGPMILPDNDNGRLAWRESILSLDVKNRKELLFNLIK